MALQIIRETIEQDDVVLDSTGEAFIQKRINLQEGSAHHLIQTDIFCDSFIGFEGSCVAEMIISPYPVIPTKMTLSSSFAGVGRYPCAGEDQVLFKANCTFVDQQTPTFDQFPSPEIAARQMDTFYSNHIYINLHLVGDPDKVLTGLALSFLMVLNNKKAPLLTSTMGQMAENYDAMCAELMNNGHMTTRALLKGNVFPMWRYGGIRPEFMLSPAGAGSFFLQMPSQDEESMQTTVAIRLAVNEARTMGAYDSAFGDKFPDWCRFGLNEGLVSGPVRDQWPPIKHADNGNVLCL